MTWGLILSNQAERVIKRVQRHERDQLRAALYLLTDNPFDGDVKQLQGLKGVFRRRVGSWRVLFQIDAKRRQILVTAIKRRGSNTY